MGGDEHQEIKKKNTLHNVSIEYKEEQNQEYNLSVLQSEESVGYDVDLVGQGHDAMTPLTPMWEPDTSSTFKFRDEDTTPKIRLSFNTDSLTNSDDDVAF